MFDTFPFSNKLETFKFSLLAYPFVYKKITDEDCLKLLTKKGDFVMDLGEADTLFLYLQSDETKVNLFRIKLCILYNPKRIGFSFGEKEFTTLTGLISHFCKHRFHFNEERMRLRSAIYRETLNGGFGYGTPMTFENGKKSFIRSLNGSLTANLSSCCDILEELLQLKHENICQIIDFDTCERGEGLPAIILIQSDFHPKNLKDHLSSAPATFPPSKYIFWLHQVTLALTYLRENGIGCKRLSLRSCLLNEKETIKLTDFWSDSDDSNANWWTPRMTTEYGIFEQACFRNDHWRYVAPEVLIGHPWTEQSFIWTFAIFCQQLFTHGKRPHRSGYSSLVDFLNAGAIDEKVKLPESLIPPALSKLLIQSFIAEANGRPTFSELVNAVNTLYNRSKIVNFFNKF